MAGFFLSSIFYIDKYYKVHQQQEVNKHAFIIPDSLWLFGPSLAKDYLQLASKVNKYKKQLVLFSSNEEFIAIDLVLDNPVDLLF
ncbi:MAG: hypothetical protein ACJAUP_000367 [Cellvibrionaceae bacterium]|jgi:hypothetical protein